MENYPSYEDVSDTVANGASKSQIVRWLREGVDVADLQLQPLVVLLTQDLSETAS